MNYLDFAWAKHRGTTSLGKQYQSKRAEKDSLVLTREPDNLDTARN